MLLPDALIPVLRGCLTAAQGHAPSDWSPLRLGDCAIGHVSPQRRALLMSCWPELRMQGDALVWDAMQLSVRARSLRIAAVALALRERGVISGWRDERHDCERPVDDPCARRGEVLFQLERAAFRCFGLMSRAVHVNGLLPDRRLLCGRRSMSKATDPGKLDNLAAGGVSAGEDLIECARRELLEEAGVPASIAAAVRLDGALRSTRVVPEGLHDEVLHIGELPLPTGFVARNGDGEVSEFVTLDAISLGQRLAQGEFSIDAAAATAWSLLRSGLRSGQEGPT